jgi:N-acetylmuramoyl-L-alanine amidase
MAKVYVGVGHGGKDPGAVSGKHKEKVYALDIATACTAELMRHGVKVMQSRTTDTTEALTAKIKECNLYAPDLCLDIHLNAGGGVGFEIFHSVKGGKGKTMAQHIEREVKAIGQDSRGIKTKKNSGGKDYFGFIRQTVAPAVLVECAFIDTKDVQIIDTPEERTAMGKAIAHGVLATLGIAFKPIEKKKAVDGLLRIQVGAFSEEANAQKQLEKLKAAGFDAYIVRS